MLAPVAPLTFALLLMTFGAELLVRGASALAFRLRLSPLFVGLTVVALGTSSPELMSSVVAALRGSSDIAVGNVVGSNVFNIAAILGGAALIRPIRVNFAAIRRDVLVACAVATVPWLALLRGGVLTRGLGIAMVGGLAAHTYAAFRAARQAGVAEQQLASAEAKATVGVAASPPVGGRAAALGDLALASAGLLLLIFGARAFVVAAIEIARAAGLSELTIALTVVAVGTSMPELVTSVVAAIRGQSDIAVGNVVGSNVFNVLGVLGVCALVHPQRVPSAVLWLHGPLMLLASLALLPIVRTGGQISRLEGAALLAGYLVYVGALVARAH